MDVHHVRVCKVSRTRSAPNLTISAEMFGLVNVGNVEDVNRLEWRLILRPMAFQKCKGGKRPTTSVASLQLENI